MRSQPHPYLRPMQPQKRSIWRWFRSRHPLAQIGLGCFTLIVLLFVGIICAIGTPAAVQGVQDSYATQTATHTTPVASPSNQGDNQPHIGSTLDSFMSAYGTPTQTSPNSETFVYNKVTIIAYVNTSRIVDRIAITGPATWRPQDTQANCAVLLPNDAKSYQGSLDAGYIDYHSSLGEITMQLQAQNCLLFVAPSS